MAKSSVKSIRLSDEAWAELAAKASDRALTVNAFIALALGYGPGAATAPYVPEPVLQPPRKASSVTQLPVTQPARPAPVTQVQERKVRIRGFSALTGEAILQPDSPAPRIKAKHKAKP